MGKQVPGARAKNAVAKRIHFFRADCGRDDSGTLIEFNPQDALEHIDSLPFTAKGRYHEVDDNIYCLWIDQAKPRQKLRFAVVRRGGLPYVEEAGIVRALDIPETAGLVEQIHVRLFPNGIAGCESNFYGPRLPRLGRYLTDRAEGKCSPVVFEPLIRRDTEVELKEQNAIRLFRLRIRRSELERLEAMDEDLGSAFRAAAKVSDADQLEVALRTKPYSRGFLESKLLQKAKKLAGKDDIRGVATEFKVEVAPDAGMPTEQLDVLGDRFIAERRILKQSGRGRVLKSSSAYTQIEAAWKDRREELERAAALAADSTG